MPDFPNITSGEVSLPTSSPADASLEDALIGPVDDVEENPHQPFNEDSEAQTYFDSVTENEALNYIIFLHDMHSISFDRLNELKILLSKTSNFLPEDD